MPIENGFLKVDSLSADVAKAQTLTTTPEYAPTTTHMTVCYVNSANFSQQYSPVYW